MHGNAVIEWTDETMETLRARWMNGDSAAVIARALGGVCTRNAVIAKIHRMGLVRGAPTAPQAKAPKPIIAKKPKAAPPEPIRPDPPAPSALRIIKSAAGKSITMIVPQDAPQVCEVVKIEFVGRNACKWPIGDPQFEGFSFCGDRVHIGVDAAGQQRVWSYCLPHCRVAYPLFGKKADKRPNARERREAARYT